MSSIILMEIKTETDVESLRILRNECRSFMTRNTNNISYEQQKFWYENLDRDNNKLFLVYETHYGVALSVIGYGYIRNEYDCCLLSGGLSSDSRGKGYGSILFSFLVENSKKFNKPIKLEVLKSNIVAFSIYNKLGFRVIADNGKIITMEYFYDSSI